MLLTLAPTSRKRILRCLSPNFFPDLSVKGLFFRNRRVVGSETILDSEKASGNDLRLQVNFVFK